MGVRAYVGRALYIVVAAIDVGSATGAAGIAKRQHQYRAGSGDGIAVGVLRLTHRPDNEAGAVFREHLGGIVHLLFRHTGHFFHRRWRVAAHDFLAHLVHAVDALLDELLVFPAVGEDVIEQTEQERHVGTRAQPHVLIGFCRRAGVARVGDNDLGTVFLGVQGVQHGNGVRFGGIRAEEEQTLRILLVVVGIGHGAVTPGIGNPGDRGGMADARLVIDVVRSPERDPFAHQIRLFVVVL